MSEELYIKREFELETKSQSATGDILIILIY